MKLSNAGAVWLACAGLGLALVVCSDSAASDPEPGPPAAPAPQPGTAPAADVPPATSPPAVAAAASEEAVIEVLTAANANRGNRQLFTDPTSAASAFLAAVKAKDLNKIAQATALHAATESRNQKLFLSILSQKLAKQEVDALAEKLADFRVAGMSGGKAGIVTVLLTKRVGDDIMRRSLKTRHEKAGWKVQDISGEGKLNEPILISAP